MRLAFLLPMVLLPVGCIQLPPSMGESIRKSFLDAIARPYRIEAWQRQGKTLEEAERLAAEAEAGHK